MTPPRSLPCLALVCCLPAAPLWSQEPPAARQTAVRVNEEQVGPERVIIAFWEQWARVVEESRDGKLKPAPADERIQAVWNEAMETTVQDALLDQLGRARRAAVLAHCRALSAATGEDIETRFQKLEADHVRKMRDAAIEAAGGDKELQAALLRKGQSMESWTAQLRREFFRRWVLEERLGPIFAAPAAVRAYFDAHRAEFARPETWRLRRLLIPKDKFATPEEAARHAAEIHRSLKEGVDFAKLAAELKYDPPYEAQGGLLSAGDAGGSPAGRFPLEEKLASSLQDGAFSEPFDAGKEILIVKREGHRPAGELSWEEALPLAESKVFAELLRQRKREFFTKQKESAYLEVLMPKPPAELAAKARGQLETKP